MELKIMEGDPMELKIMEGDTIIARKQSIAENNDVIVCVYDYTVMIKQFLRIGNRIVLHSFNEQHNLIEVKGELRIECVVKNIIHSVKNLN